MENAEAILEANDIVDIVSGFIKLKKHDSVYLGCCPFHQESNPSMIIDPNLQMFYCPVCGASGNAIDFVMKNMHIPLHRAINMLSNHVHMHPKKDDKSEIKRMQDEIYAINKETAKFYCDALYLPENTAGLDYLHRRGLTDRDIKHFGLGFAMSGNKLKQYLTSCGYSKDLMQRAGLVQNRNEKTNDRFKNRIIYPILNVQNQVAGFGGRVLNDSKPKYLNTCATPVFNKSYILYGLNFMDQTSRKLLLCEGYMDVIAVQKSGYPNAVASLGTALTAKHATILKRYADEVILAYDEDEPGVNATMNAIPILNDAGLHCRILHTDPCKDPDEFIKKFGYDAFIKRIDDAQDSLHFELTVLGRKYQSKEKKTRTNALNRILDLLEKTDGSHELLCTASKMCGISEKQLKEQLKMKQLHQMQKAH